MDNRGSSGPNASPGAAFTFPDGAPWEAAEHPAGCASCHFDAPVREGSPALAVLGLPAHVKAGETYRLTVRLAADMRTAGFLLSISQDGAPTGTLRAVDQRTAVQGSQARSTGSGSTLSRPGRAAEWTLEWTAPQPLSGALSFDLWANAANETNPLSAIGFTGARGA